MNTKEMVNIKIPAHVLYVIRRTANKFDVSQDDVIDFILAGGDITHFHISKQSCKASAIQPAHN